MCVCVCVCVYVCVCLLDKLTLTGRNLGRVFNCRTCKGHAIEHITKYLKLKTWPKQLLDSLPLNFTLPDTCICVCKYTHTHKHIHTHIHLYINIYDNF